MKTHRLTILAALAFALCATPASAIVTLGGDVVTTVNGTFTDPAGLFFGTYLQGADGFGHTPNPNSYAYNIPAGGPSNGNARDYWWLHDTGNAGVYNGVTGGNPMKGLWFDLGGQANKVVVFPTIDHGPLPGEALEHTVYLSNDRSSWVRAKLETVYDQGFDPNPAIADGWVGVYSLASGQTFQYASVAWGGASSILADGDTEIDAIAGLTEDGGAIPEPGTLSLLALGLGGIVARRIRRRK